MLQSSRRKKVRRMFFFSSRRRHTRLQGDWSSDVCSSDLDADAASETVNEGAALNTLVGIDADSVDPNGPAVTWSIISDDSSGGLQINLSTGIVTVAAPRQNHLQEPPALGHSPQIVVQASD